MKHNEWMLFAWVLCNWLSAVPTKAVPMPSTAVLLSSSVASQRKSTSVMALTDSGYLSISLPHALTHTHLFFLSHWREYPKKEKWWEVEELWGKMALSCAAHSWADWSVCCRASLSPISLSISHRQWKEKAFALTELGGSYLDKGELPQSVFPTCTHLKQSM